MADRVILDFENNTIEWDTDHQKGTEVCLDLAERKDAILAAMGYSQIDFSDDIDAINRFINGLPGKRN